MGQAGRVTFIMRSHAVGEECAFVGFGQAVAYNAHTHVAANMGVLQLGIRRRVIPALPAVFTNQWAGHGSMAAFKAPALNNRSLNL